MKARCSHRRPWFDAACLGCIGDRYQSVGEFLVRLQDLVDADDAPADPQTVVGSTLLLPAVAAPWWKGQPVLEASC